MDLSGHGLNLTKGLQQQGRGMGSSGSKNQFQSPLMNKSSSQQQQAAAAAAAAALMPSQLELLSQIGGVDINALAAAAAAAGGIPPGFDATTMAAMANLSALAQFNSFAGSPGVAGPGANQKLANSMLKQQQQQQPGPSTSSNMSHHQQPQLQQQSQQHHHHHSSNHHQAASNSASNSGSSSGKQHQVNARYQQLLAIIDEIGKDIRPSYLGNKNSIERLKRGLVSARILVKDCQIECERNTKN